MSDVIKGKAKFILKAKKKFGDLYSYDDIDYVSMKTPIKLFCKIHGEFEKTPTVLLQSKGCQRCAKIGASKGFIVKDTEGFKIRAGEIHKDLYDYSKVDYINSQTKVTVICKVHSKEFQVTPNSHIKGTGCPECGEVKRRKSKSYTQQEFIDELKLIHNNKYDYTETVYKSCYEKITYR